MVLTIVRFVGSTEVTFFVRATFFINENLAVSVSNNVGCQGGRAYYTGWFVERHRLFFGYDLRRGMITGSTQFEGQDGIILTPK